MTKKKREAHHKSHGLRWVGVAILGLAVVLYLVNAGLTLELLMTTPISDGGGGTTSPGPAAASNFGFLSIVDLALFGIAIALIVFG